MKSFIAFDRNKIYTSLLEPDLNPKDTKLILLLKLTHELGKFGYILSEEAIKYLSEEDIHNYFRDIIPVLYCIYYHKNYTEKSDLGDINKYLENWKSRRKQPWTNNFYLFSDLAFIYRESRRVNNPMTYLKRLDYSGLFLIYKELIERPSISKIDLPTVKYLSEIYKSETVNPGCNLATLIVSLWDDNYRPQNLSDYIELKPNRKERRLILNKLETKIDLSNEPKKDIKKLLKKLHLKEYKKAFPKVYEFYKKLQTEDEDDSYMRAKYLIDSGKIEEFTDLFMSFIYNSDNEENITALLYSNKLRVTDYLKILKSIQINELGVPRYFSEVYFTFPRSKILLIPIIKEFIMARLESIIGDRVKSLSNKKIYISDELKRLSIDGTIEYVDLEKRELKHITKELEFSVQWDHATCKRSELNVYLWKGPGTKIKKYKDNQPESPRYLIETNLVDIKSFIEKGYKYIIFDNRVSEVYSNLIGIEINVGSNKFYISRYCRNNFGGIIDLKTLEITFLDFDLKKIPIINGNLQEAIIKYTLPEFRSVAYDFIRNCFTSFKLEISDNPEESDIIVTKELYKNLLYD